MSQVITLTPSEFMLAVHENRLAPNQLCESAGILTDNMRAYYLLDIHPTVTEKPIRVLIDGRNELKITITKEAATWSQLISVAEADLISGVPFSEVIYKLIDLQFKYYLYKEEPQCRSIRNLFDTLYHHLAHFDKEISQVSH